MREEFNTKQIVMIGSVLLELTRSQESPEQPAKWHAKAFVYDALQGAFVRNYDCTPIPQKDLYVLLSKLSKDLLQQGLPAHTQSHYSFIYDDVQISISRGQNMHEWIYAYHQITPTGHFVFFHQLNITDRNSIHAQIPRSIANLKGLRWYQARNADPSEQPGNFIEEIEAGHEQRMRDLADSITPKPIEEVAGKEPSLNFRRRYPSKPYEQQVKDLIGSIGKWTAKKLRKHLKGKDQADLPIYISFDQEEELIQHFSIDREFLMIEDENGKERPEAAIVIYFQTHKRRNAHE